MIDFAEILPYLFIFIGFLTMVFIAKFRRDLFTDEPTTISITEVAKNVPVDRIESPFTINIDENRSTLKDGVFVRIQTKISCQLRAYWFVNIQQFYTELDSNEFRTNLYENRFLKTNCLEEQIFNFDNPGDFNQHIQLNNEENNFINNNNQTRREYPLVLVLHSSKKFSQSPIQIAILHVKSSISTDPSTKFIVRISKLSDGRSLVLQDIFTPGAFISDDACSICLTERVSHVLLPCKHACICENCFNLIDKCPVCQRFVVSYFRM